MTLVQAVIIKKRHIRFYMRWNLEMTINLTKHITIKTLLRIYTHLYTVMSMTV